MVPLILGRVCLTVGDYTPLASLDQFFHQRGTVINMILRTFKVLLDHCHKSRSVSAYCAVLDEMAALRMAGSSEIVYKQ